MKKNNTKTVDAKDQRKKTEDNSRRLQQYALLGLKIAFYRKQKGLSQLELAEKVKISRTYMSNIEAPKCIVNPTLDVIFDIAEALKIPVSKLFDTDTL